jgi:hypothetical protein
MEPTMSEFVYLYRRPPLAPETPQQMQQRLGRWRAWLDRLEKDGHLAALGQPLSNTEGAVVRDVKGRSTDGPYAETKDIVVGYSLIRANDLDHAKALVADWPGFDEGGMVEVRPVLKL